MKRNTSALTDKEYDLVVVGGGIFGICAAWDAALRGLSVALIERGDFAHATSANCFKMIHGGIRYLQHGDVNRVRESCHERSTMFRIAPHLAEPLPIVVPTYGRGTQSKQFLMAGLLAYDLLTLGRNRGIADPDRHIPRGNMVSRNDCLSMFPGVNEDGLTGGVLFYDGQMYSPSRLGLSFIHSAVQAGADVANYVEATGFLRDEERVFGIKARDVLTGDDFEVRGKVVLNAAGPWAEQILDDDMGLNLNPRPEFSRDAYIVINRRLTGKHALAVQGATRDPDAVISRGNRHLFMVPWRDYTLIGVWHVVNKGRPDEVTLTEGEVQGFLDEFNSAYSLDEPLTLDDVSMWNYGLTLFGENDEGSTNLSYGKRSRIVDHAREHGVEGLITLVGVRYTTARGESEKTVNLVFDKLGKRAPKSMTAVTTIRGGHIEDFNAFERKAIDRDAFGLDSNVIRGLVRNHGSDYNDVLRYVQDDASLVEQVAGSTVLKAELAHAIHDEMAMKLGDVVFRRTDLGTGEHPGEEALKICANLMATELGWDSRRTERELDEVRAMFPKASVTAV